MAFFTTSFKKAICDIGRSSNGDISRRTQIKPDDEDMTHPVKNIRYYKTLRVVSVPNHDMIASCIQIATEKTWKNYRRTMIHAENDADTTPSTPHSEIGNEKKMGYLVEALSRQKLNFRAACLELELYKQCKTNEELEKRHLEQYKQRLRDKAMVDQVFEEFSSMKTMYEDITKEHEESKALLKKKDGEHQAAIQEKEQELQKFITDHRSTLAAIHETYEAKLAEANQDAAEKRHVLETRHLEALRALTEASKTNRCIWENAQKAMVAEGEQMACEYRDALRDNEDEILRLTKCNHDLEAENSLLVGTLTDRPGNELHKHAQIVFEEIQCMKSELGEARTDLRVAHIKIENILEAMQQQRDHYESHGHKEQEAQAQVYDLRRQILELQEKLTIRDDLLRAADTIPKDTNIMESESLSDIASKMEKAGDDLKLLHAENAELRSKSNKVDDENLEISLKFDMIEYEVHVARNKLGVLEAKQSLLIRERDFLADAIAEDNCLTAEDKDLLRRHLRQMREENERLRDRNVSVAKENADLQAYIKRVQDKAEVNIQQAEKGAAYWQTLYWDEAVPKTEALSKEIHELNKELGRENVHVQERLERNVVVSDRNVLRYACAATLRGVDTNLIPAEYYEPGFIPGWLPATHDALRLLRPLGWVPVAELEKVWLAPMYKPFTEEDAKQRLEAQGQIVRKQHREAMGAPPLPEDPSETVSENAAATAGPVQLLSPSWVPISNRAPMPHTPYEEPYAPPYQTAWQKKRANLTRDAYNDMDNTLKLDVLEMLGIHTECAETLGSSGHTVSYNYQEYPDIF
ncbi:hypothetical protein COCSADRAFT_352860 [Bipolaris sorokiniana ND90Pr]|uniref:Uncharacterized protein n=1 Tax=Cochliobolus sativus (strain ND90Pr / ATCC 201652) TaxID=665912 RepID=M2TF25_COCSN|nr:uncharacterized protein COCSADRAFT_352860 [Bipolaris sorokiniana ND90Pr]EMD67841.1 hypothetical protein COCSADRAFT_352860 [Bipolaris sorokiniana ND90Pr]